jgi:hypothetical protein
LKISHSRPRTSSGGGWTLVVTRGNIATGDPTYGTALNSNDPNQDHIFGGPSTGGGGWAGLKFTEMWVQMGGTSNSNWYQDSFYFEGVDSDDVRNRLHDQFVTRQGGTAHLAGRLDCRIFLREVGHPGSGGTMCTTCGGADDSWAMGPIGDGSNACMQSWCYWSYDYHNSIGTGLCPTDGSSGSSAFGGRGRVWVRGAAA